MVLFWHVQNREAGLPNWTLFCFGSNKKVLSTGLLDRPKNVETGFFIFGTWFFFSEA